MQDDDTGNVRTPEPKVSEHLGQEAEFNARHDFSKVRIQFSLSLFLGSLSCAHFDLDFVFARLSVL